MAACFAWRSTIGTVPASSLTVPAAPFSSGPTSEAGQVGTSIHSEWGPRVPSKGLFRPQTPQELLDLGALGPSRRGEGERLLKILGGAGGVLPLHPGHASPDVRLRIVRIESDRLGAVGDCAVEVPHH